MYTVEDARREVRELIEEGYGFDYIRIFLNDLTRGKDITREDNKAIMCDMIEGKFGKLDTCFGTFA